MRLQEKPAHRSILTGEQGSVLLITLLTVALMVIMGVLLLQVVQQGLRSSTASEARILADSLAQRGLDEALATLTAAAESASQQVDYRTKANWLEQHISAILATLPGRFTAADPRGSYSIEVKSGVEDLRSTPLGNSLRIPDLPYVRKITIRSTGQIAVSPVVTVSKQMTVYLSSLNPVMRYALSADTNSHPQSGSGTASGQAALRLNGAAYIVGNIFADGDFSVSASASFMKEPGVSGQIATSLPSLRGYYYTTGKMLQPQDKRFGSGSIPLADPSLKKSEPIDVEGIVAKAVVRHTRSGKVYDLLPELLDATQLQITGRNKGGKHYDQIWVSVAGATEWVRPAGGQPSDVLIRNGLFDMLPGSSLKISGGSLVIDSPNPDIVTASLSGELALEEDQALLIRGNAVINDGFRLTSGRLFVQGDLKIYGDVNLYGTVYVDGDVELRDLKSLNSHCNASTSTSISCGPLIIAASGKIELSEYVQDRETQIHAFLYANQEMKLYGVYSRIKIVGGLHGAGLELNAAKGTLLPIAGAGASAPVWSKFMLPEQSRQSEISSRLQVVHDINLYEQPPAGIPVTDIFNIYVSDSSYANN